MTQEDLKTDATVYDVCVIGAGAVGYTIAKHLKEWAHAKQKKIIVLESAIENETGSPDGSRNYDPIVRPLDFGTVSSFMKAVRPDFLTQSRTRAIGGSTNCWGGYMRPLDPYDFGLGHWPIQRVALDKYYRLALELIGMEPDSYDHMDDLDNPKNFQYWQERSKDKIELMDPKKLAAAGLKQVIMQQQNTDKLRNFEDSEIFKNVFDPEFVVFKNNATVVTLSIDKPNKYRVSTVWYRQFVGGKPDNENLYNISARQIVLAMGGLEIPRFLLNLGNESIDNNKKAIAALPDIGKFYMNHPKYENAFNGTAKFPKGSFSVSTAAQNFLGGVHIKTPTKDSDVSIYGYITPNINGIIGRRNFRIQASIKEAGTDQYNASWEVNYEQLPIRESRVELDPNTQAVDLFNKRKLTLTWQFGPDDWKILNSAVTMPYILWLQEQYGAEFPEQPHMTVWYPTKPFPPEKDFIGRPMYTGDHHLGTCRMRPYFGQEGEGVVDSNCRVFGFENLWICSTAVFPSGGWANSTMTLLALTIRLCDTLKAI